MKLSPFSPADRFRLQRAIRDLGAWSGVRAGRRCHLAETTTLEHGRAISWVVIKNRHRITGVAPTVSQALEDMNKEIWTRAPRRGGRPRKNTQEAPSL